MQEVLHHDAFVTVASKLHACTQPANTALGSDPITGTGSSSQLVGLHLRNPSLMDHYSFNRPRRDGWLSWPCWLTDSGRLTHKVVTRPAISLVQDRESSPARTGVLTTMLRHQLAMADYIHVFEITNLTVLAQWNCVKQYIFRLAW